MGVRQAYAWPDFRRLRSWICSVFFYNGIHAKEGKEQLGLNAFHNSAVGHYQSRVNIFKGTFSHYTKYLL
jgi:hypothetical protein